MATGYRGQPRGTGPFRVEEVQRGKQLEQAMVGYS